MATEVERLIVTLEAQLGKYNADMNRAQGITNQKLAAMEGRFASFARSSSTSIGSIGVALGTLGTYLSAGQLLGYANAWLRVERAVTSGAEVFGVAVMSASDLNQLANEARVDVEAYAKLYVRTSAAIRDYGFEAGTAEKVTSTLSKALKLGGAAASEQASVLLQFSQALQKGKLDGDEFRSVMENAGVVQELLADRLKVSKGEIVKMAGDGKLKIKDLVGAMTDGADKVHRLFAGIPATTDEAWTVLNNSVTEYVGNLDKTYGITSSVVGVTNALARNISTVGDAALVLGAGFLAAFAPAIVAGAIGMAAAIAAAAGPLGILIGLVTAGTAGVALFGDKIKVSENGAISLKDAVNGLAEAMTTGAEATRGFEGTMHGFGIEIEDTGAKVESFIEKARRLAEVSAIEPKLAGFGGKLKSYLDGTLKDRPALKKGPTPTDNDPNARKNAYEREIASIKKKIEAAQAEAKVIGASADVIERARSKQALLTAAREAEIKLTPEVIAAVDRLSAAYGKAASEVAYLNAIRNAKEGNEAIEREIALIGKQGFELHRARMEQELLNAAKKAGRALTPERLAEIDAISRQNAALAQTRDVMRDIEQLSQDALKGFVNDLREGKSAAESLGNVMNKIADKLIDMAVNDLVGAALGGLNGGGGGAGIGGLLSGIFSGFADGGIAANGMRKFANGGVSNRAAIFGEAGPEAAVPLPDGRRIPVDLRMPQVPSSGSSGPSSVTIAPVFNVQNGTPDGIDKLKTEIVPLMRQVARSEVATLFDRSAKFKKIGG